MLHISGKTRTALLDVAGVPAQEGLGGRMARVEDCAGHDARCLPAREQICMPRTCSCKDRAYTHLTPHRTARTGKQAHAGQGLQHALHQLLCLISNTRCCLSAGHVVFRTQQSCLAAATGAHLHAHAAHELSERCVVKHAAPPATSQNTDRLSGFTGSNHGILRTKASIWPA